MRNLIDLVETKNPHLSEYKGSGSLYHGTDILSLAWIISSNYMTKSIDTDHPDHAGVSLAYEEKAAWEFADRSSYIFRDNRYNIGLCRNTPLTGAVLTLNTEKLRSHYRLVYYWYDLFFDDDEKEIRVLTNEIKPLNNFLTGFKCRPQDIEWFADYLRSSERDYDDPGPEYAQMILDLLKHPLFHPI